MYESTWRNLLRPQKATWTKNEQSLDPKKIKDPRVGKGMLWDDQEDITAIPSQEIGNECFGMVA